MMKRPNVWLSLLMTLVGLLIFGCSAKQQQTPQQQGQTSGNQPVEPVTLKAVVFLPRNHPLAAALPTFIDKVKEKSKGEVLINFLGGPEVIPALEQVEALRKGKVIDMAFAVTAYYQATVPEGLAMHLSRLLPWEERKSGFYDAMVTAHEKQGIRYLGRWLYSPFYLWSAKPVAKPEDLRGMKMRTQALYDRFMKALGITPVSIAHGDTYTALERGMVEGFGWPILGARSDGWTEKAKYLIDHSFYDMQNATILLNLDKWKSLTPGQQEALQQAAVEFEPLMVDYFKKKIDEELTVLTEQEGIKRVQFAPADAERYVNTAYEVEWKALEEKLPADVVQKLKELSSKK